ncbi:MAG: YoaK family protein [Dokdonella sp.]
MFAKLPTWVLYGAVVLAFIAGIINATGFLGVQHEGITHLTGTTTLLGLATADFDLLQMLHFAAMIGAFIVGAIVSGAVIQDSTLRLGRRYGIVLLAESFLLVAAVPLLLSGHVAGDYMASAACGLQNAMVSTYSGAVLRTTHVSGTLTDIGIFIGHWLRGLPIDRRRLRLLLSLVLAFFAGAVIGAWLFHAFSYRALYLPAAATGLIGLGYTAWRQWQRGR